MELFKKITLLMIMLMCPFVFGGCNQKSPEITASIKLSNITEEEYSKINTSPKDVTISDLKKLYIDVKMTNSKKATRRIITIPNLFIIDRYDRIRSTVGGSSEQNNIGTEDTAESTAYVIFDSKGLSEQDLRNLYRESKIYIAYKLKNGNLIEKSISVGEDLRLNN